MNAAVLKRRLAALLMADAVGYSRLMSIDEAKALRELDLARVAFRSAIEANAGRVVDTAGDSILAIFDSATGAAFAALTAQAVLEPATADRPLMFRVGLHLGDVIERPDGSVHGDGVNVAARLQALADPGGIVVSDALRGAVRGKVDAGFEERGEQTLKNIDEPVRAFCMHRATPNTEDEVGARFDGTSISHRIVNMDAPVHGFDGRPAIAVLPFLNLSDDTSQAYFAEGLTEDISTRLAMGRWFPIIARTTTFTYRGAQHDLQDIGRSFGARYVVEGSVRRTESRVRVTARLIEAATSHQLWAAKYDRHLDNIFEIQDELTEGIAGALGAAAERAEVERGRTRLSHNLDAWEALWRGAWFQQQCTREGFAAALPLFELAVKLDPTLAVAHSAMAWQKILEAVLLWTSDPAAAISLAVASARRAIAADPNDSIAYSIMGNASAYAGQYEDALTLCRKGVELNPSNANGYGCLALPHLLTSETAAAIEAAQMHIRLSPNDVWLQAPLGILAVGHYQARNYEEALKVATWTIQRAPAYPSGWRTRCAALAQLGRLDEAQDALSTFLSLVPSYTNARVARSMMPFRDHAAFEHFVEGLRKSGWPG